MTQFSFGSFFLALGFFIYGIRLVQDGLGIALADRFRSVVHNLSSNRAYSFLSGVLMTLMLQSSTAASITLLGFVNVGFLTPLQAIAMTLGADLGTGLLVLFLASCAQFDVSIVSTVVLGTAFFANIAVRSRRWSPYLRFLLGLGFVLFGLGSMSEANRVLMDSRLLQEIVLSLSEQPLLACIISALVAGFLQNSAVVLGLVMSIFVHGAFTLEHAIPFIAGANLGSMSAVSVASMRAGIEGRRLAFLRGVFRLTGIAALFLVSEPFARWAGTLGQPIAYQIALTHIMLNACTGLAYLPFIGWMREFAVRAIREHPSDRKFEPKYLDTRAITTPAVAFANVHREILRMTEIAQDMFSHVLTPFESGAIETMEYIDDLDDKIDLLNREIKFYLAKLNQAELTDTEGKRQIELMMLTNSIEGVGDVISNDIMQIAEKKRRKGLQFSQDGWKEIKDFHARVMENFQLAVTCLASGDHELGQKALKNKKLLAQYEQELGQRHLLRLHHGFKESFDTSSIHLDLLSNLRRINSVVCKMAYPVLDRRVS